MKKARSAVTERAWLHAPQGPGVQFIHLRYFQMNTEYYPQFAETQHRVVPTSLSSNDLEDAVAAWVECGWQPIPVRADNKRPLVSWREQSQRLPDESAKTVELFRRFANRQMPIMVGIALPEDVVVLDVDHRPDNGWIAMETAATLGNQYGLPQQTPVSRTPSGGFHIWLSLPPGAKARNWTSAHNRFPVPGVDIRTSGGFVVVPPSIRADGANYNWIGKTKTLPMATKLLVQDLCPPRVSTRSVPLPSRPKVLAPYVERAYASEIAAVRLCSRGGRNDQLFRSSAALGSFIGAGLLPRDHVVRSLLLAAEDCGLRQDDGPRAIMATIESGIGCGLAQPRKIEGAAQ